MRRHFSIIVTPLVLAVVYSFTQGNLRFIDKLMMDD